MDKVTLYYHRETDTMDIWFDDPLHEVSCEEAIEVDSGEYFVGNTPQEALRRAAALHPHKAFYVIRIGYKAAYKLKRGWSKGL